MFLEYSDWPDAAIAVALNRPFAVIDLSYRLTGAGVVIEAPELGDLDMPDRVFAKLGPKSWRNGPGGVCVPGEGAALLRRLARPTREQAHLIAAMAAAGAPLRLYLFEGRDFAGISEYRMQLCHGQWRQQSVCLRGRAVDPTCLTSLLARLSEVLPFPVTLDIACLSDGSLRLVDINPGLRTVPTGLTDETFEMRGSPRLPGIKDQDRAAQTFRARKGVKT